MFARENVSSLFWETINATIVENSRMRSHLLLCFDCGGEITKANLGRTLQSCGWRMLPSPQYFAERVTAAIV
jgi:hypothetical protein